jgi:hypothetical protein
MTRERDFDLIARTWLDIGPSEAPDRVIHAVLDAVETTPQVRRPWPWPTWRSRPMNRLPMFAVIAGLIIVAVGAVVMTTGRAPATPLPSTPSSVLPSTAASQAAAGATPIPKPIPTDILGTWVAPLRPAPGITQADTSSIWFNDAKARPAEPQFALFLGAHSFPQQGGVVEVEPGVIRIISRQGPGGCKVDDVGIYRWSKPAPDRLVLDLVSDVCAARKAVVPGRWVPSGIGRSTGGEGIAADFTPFFRFTLPSGSYEGLGNSERDWISVPGADRSLFDAYKDPDGFVDPCDYDKGRVDLDPGLDAFVTYLSSSKRVKVTTTTDMTVDGHRAVAVTYGAAAGLPAGCRELFMWAPHSWKVQGASIPTDATDTIIVTDVDGTTILFRLLDSAGAVRQDVVSSIHFIDALPT